MQKKDEKIQKLEQWCQGLIDDFRTEYEKLDELEQEQILVSINYSAPCQIEIFWALEPEYQLFVLSHNANRPDKEIKINGPFKAPELEKEVIKIMDESRWKKRIPPQENYLPYNFDIWKQINRYSDILVGHFLHFLDILRNDCMTNLPDGLIDCLSSLDNIWMIILKGNVAKCGYFEKEVTKSLESAKIRATSIRNGSVSKILQPQSIKDDKPLVRVIGTYYYPGVFIGDNVEPSFEDRLHGPNIVEYPKCEFDFTFNDRKVFCDKYGFVVVQIEDEKRAIKILNTIFGVSLILGIKSYPVRKFDLISSEMKSDVPVLGNSLGGCRWDSHNKRFEPMNFMGPRETKISLDKMKDIIKITEIIYRDQKLNDLLLFLLESYTHMDSLESSQSFLFSWFIVERHISQLSIKAGSKQKDHIATKIKDLNNSGIIDGNIYEFLTHHREIRNNFIHTGKTITEYESAQLFEFSRDIVKSEINEILKEEGLKEI